MPKKTYDIILTGATTDGSTLEVASRKLAHLFRISEIKARALFMQAPIRVKKGINEHTAIQFEQAFARANIKVRFQDSGTPLVVKSDFHNTSAALGETAIELSSQAEQVQGRELTFKIEGSKAFGFLSVVIPEEQTLWVESTSVVSSEAHITLNGHDSSIRKLRGAEGVYISEYRSFGKAGEIGLSPSLPGEILHIPLKQQTVLIKTSAFLASAPGVTLDDAARETAASYNIEQLRCHGLGDLWLQVCGSVLELTVNGRYCVRAPHLLAWTEGLAREPFPTPLGNDLINVLGHGKIWLQSQTDESLVSWAAPFRRNIGP